MTDRPPDLSTWNAWRDIHQPFELAWWKEALERGHSKHDHGFYEQWLYVHQWVKPRGAVIDIGSGPRPPFKPKWQSLWDHFGDDIESCRVIDPLADEYRKFAEPGWWEGVEVSSVKAETLIAGLSADTVICWNCIDHTIGWRDILDNMKAYGKPDARFAIATDFHEPFIGHPGFRRDEFMVEIDKRFTITDKREPFGRDLALLMRHK